jgi:hypothetical protein
MRPSYLFSFAAQRLSFSALNLIKELNTPSCSHPLLRDLSVSVVIKKAGGTETLRTQRGLRVGG